MVFDPEDRPLWVDFVTCFAAGAIMAILVMVLIWGGCG